MAKLGEDVVEAIVRWYVQNGGRSGCLRLPPEFATVGGSFSPWAVRERIGVILAECPDRVYAGNDFEPEAKITVVERAIIAEIAIQDTARQLMGCPRELTANGWEPTPLSLSLVRDLEDYTTMAARFRAHPSWNPSMSYLAKAFARVAFGDRERGEVGDASFLPHILGA